MIRWFKALPSYRKVLLVLAGGMLSLVFDAVIAHMQWNQLTMRWNQWIPVVYGVIAFVVLGAVAVLPLREARGHRLGLIIGALGLVVGGGGIFFHAKGLLEAIDEETTGVVAYGKLLAAGPPLFAPASFAGVGLLIIALPAITSRRAQPPSI